MRNVAPQTYTYRARIVYNVPDYDPTRYATRDRLIHAYNEARRGRVPPYACWHAEESHPFPGINDRMVVATWTAFA